MRVIYLFHIKKGQIQEEVFTLHLIKNAQLDALLHPKNAALSMHIHEDYGMTSSVIRQVAMTYPFYCAVRMPITEGLIFVYTRKLCENYFQCYQV